MGINAVPSTEMPVYYPSFMILPSLSCQASCKYCFGPHKGAVMDPETAHETVRFVHDIARECGMDKIDIIFHGGEPLLAPQSIWKILLKGLSEADDGISVNFSVQSNLWNLNEGFIELFKTYNVDVGTSLDGPEDICDINRGTGYFSKTMPQIERLLSEGMRPGVICTFTKQTAGHAVDSMRFFRDLGISPGIHCAVKAMNANDDPYSLTAEEYAGMIKDLYPWYVSNSRYIRISTLDNYCRAAAHGTPQVCTMGDCLGTFLAISPTGDITSCQRLTGMKEFVMGNVSDHPGIRQLMESDAAENLKKRQAEVKKRCSGCGYYEICKGGCYYNAVSSGDNVIDPLCEAYKSIYSFLEERFAEEITSEENVEAVMADTHTADEDPSPSVDNPFLKKGPYISLASSVHPSVIAFNARTVLAAYYLGKNRGNVNNAVKDMIDNDICPDSAKTYLAMSDMRDDLDRDHQGLNNCYLHVTFRCNLRCTHCYASAGESDSEMNTDGFSKLANEALQTGFRQLVITGGEPLFHKDRKCLLDICRNLRGKGSKIVLRTNLTGSFTDREMSDIAGSFDQIVVSVDGNEQTHDERRGKGTYAVVVRNCEQYIRISRSMAHDTGNPPGELSLACVMDAEHINGEPGASVTELGRKLEIRRVRFRPLLPLGRAARSDTPVICEGIHQFESAGDKLKRPFKPLKTCGIGQNIYICPDGRAYPCYAWQTENSYLGNALSDGLSAIMEGKRFIRLRSSTVDTIEKCKECDYRYLCGGACRAWGNQNETDPDTAPPDCDHLKKSAKELIEAALKSI